jgi:hypothetical protein
VSQDHSHACHTAILTLLPSNSFTTAPKRYQNAGLRKKAIQNEPYDPLQCGGLGDEDADAVRPRTLPPRHGNPSPTTVFPKHLERDYTRKNNVSFHNMIVIAICSYL